MRVLILADAFFATRERSLLSRLEVGLADEGARVLHAIPDDLPGAAANLVQGGVFSTTLRYRATTMRAARTAVARRLADTIRSLVEHQPGPFSADGTQRPLDVIHVFGGSAWPLGLDLARILSTRVALEVWRAGLVERAASPAGAHPDSTTLLAPDPAIERALRDAGARPYVAQAPWGVHVAPDDKPILPEGRARCVVIVGSGRDARAFAAALEGLVRAARQHPEMRVFCDAHAARRANLWNLAKRLDFLDRFSLIEEIETRRDLLLHADILVQPDAHGEQRSIVLDAFANSMLVVALLDPMVSVLTDNATARLVRAPDPAEWAAVVNDALTHPEATAAIARQAREFVRTQRRVSDHVRFVLGAYDEMAARPVA
jgi:hypothetical protein